MVLVDSISWYRAFSICRQKFSAPQPVKNLNLDLNNCMVNQTSSYPRISVLAWMVLEGLTVIMNPRHHHCVRRRTVSYMQEMSLYLKTNLRFSIYSKAIKNSYMHGMTKILKSRILCF